MADFNNDLQQQAYQLIDILNKLSESGNSTIFEIAEIKTKLEQVLKDFPLNELLELKNALKDNNKEVVDSLNEASKTNKERIKREQEYQAEIDYLNEQIKNYNKYLEDSNDDVKEHVEKQVQQLEQERDKRQAQHDAEIAGRKAQFDAETKVKQDIEAKRKELAETAQKNAKASADKITDFVTKIASNFLSDTVRRFEGAVNGIADAYEQNAGKLSAALNVTTEDIGNLQRKIASELQDASLSKAISSIAVLTEVASLSSAGYTNVDKIQSNATAIAEARRVSPNLNLDSSTVKNLTNVFGSDFITRFSAIQAAVQDTAGSTVSLNANLSKMMTDMEPVYTNAELNNQALQDTSDIMATLSSLQDQGLITGSISDEQLNMIAQLLDPAKAIKSSNTIIKAAAGQYGMNIWGSDNPVLAAWQAIQSTTNAAYSGVGMSNSAYDRLSRGLVADVYNNTSSANASWLGPNYLRGLGTSTTGNLSNVWDEQEAKLQSGDFTTRSEELKNAFENSSIAQGAAAFKTYYPMIYGVVSGLILTSINTLPTRIATAIKAANLFSGENIAGSKLGNFLFGVSGSGTTAAGSGSTLGKLFNNFTSASLLGLGAKGSRIAKLTSGATMGMAGLGIMGLMDTLGQEGDTFWEKLGHGGDSGSAFLSGASMGAGTGAIIGSFFGPMGNVIGGVAGGLIGGVLGLIEANKANKEAQEANTKAIESQTKATTDLLGEGVSAIDTLEAKREIARGGGIVSLNSGNYAIDYVKSSYAGFATGLDYVPYDDYVVRVHKGEAIVTADAAKKLREKDPNFWNTPMNDDYDIIGALKEQTDSIVSAVNGEKKYSPLTKAGPQQYMIKNQFI